VADALHVTVRGDHGPVVALVHGIGMPARMAFARQKPLADRYRLWLIDRRGYGESPPVRGREDWEVDAADLLAVLPSGTHLVGLSYGSVGAIVAAATEPRRFASLTLVECPVFSLAPGDPAARSTQARLMSLFAETALDDHTFFVRFMDALGIPAEMPDPLPPPYDTSAQILRRHRHAWDGDLPLDAIATAGLPTLVVTSGEQPAFDAVADHLAAVLDARREYVPGQGHLVQLVGGPLNDLLDDFFSSVRQGPQGVPS
jgi:pimeloyl-ACP methyl ester carboxylesterase